MNALYIASLIAAGFLILAGIEKLLERLGYFDPPDRADERTIR